VPGVCPARQPLRAATLELFARTFERFGARLNMRLDLYSDMLDACLEATLTPIAEIGVGTGDDVPGARR
jgi:hypothetical protein